MTELHQPHSMTKYELFRLYYPDRDKKYVNAFFRSQVHASRVLMQKLHQTGYRKTCKYLSTTQVTLIFEHLTPPPVIEKP
jgi:hypothetical protein